MIFYILSIVLVLVALAIVVYTFLDNISWAGLFSSLGYTLLVAFASACAGLLILGFYSLIASAGTPLHETTGEYNLKALSNDSKQVGEYAGNIFVSYGYTDEERTINYIWQDSEGFYHLEQTSVDNSKIREVPNGTEATITVIHHEAEDTAWIPANWSFAEDWSSDEYIFTVPEGTIGSDLTIDNNK
jgi:hypothetical protein